MKIITLLNEKKDNAYPWIQNQKIKWKGHINHNSCFLKNEKAFNHISKEIDLLKSHHDLIEIIENLDGFYGFVIDFETHLVAVTDLATTVPIFYFPGNEIFVIGDNHHAIAQYSGGALNQKAIDEYLISGYVYGNKTLLDGVFQIPAGCVLTLNKLNGSISVDSYYDYLPQKKYDAKTKQTDLIEKLHEVHLQTFSQLVSGLNDQQVILPLSGGYDSRLILEMLKHFKYENILCVTWGKSTDWQSGIAKQVALDLGVDWELVNANKSDWKRWYQRSFLEEFENNGVIAAIPYVQENVLINTLKEKKLLHEDAIFLSGNTGDFIEGEHIPPFTDSITPEHILTTIQNQHQRLNRLKNRQHIDDELRQQIAIFQQNQKCELQYFFEFWEWRERQSKFVTNCVKPFENHGIEWRMPFWSKAVMNFWRDIDIDIKKDRNLFFQYASAYMNQSTTKANPKISLFKRYTERLSDPRFGCYMTGNLTEFLTLKLEHIFPNVDLYNIEKQPFIKQKINSLIAFDVINRLSNKNQTKFR